MNNTIPDLEQRGGFRPRHGFVMTRAYNSWVSMRNRCYYKKEIGYKYYGGRGINVCSRWRHSFVNFLEDMGHPPEGMTLHRKDNDGNYSPDNCSWATPAEQNAERSSSRFLEFNGMRKTITQWALHLGISRVNIYSRLKRGWPVDRALT